MKKFILFVVLLSLVGAKEISIDASMVISGGVSLGAYESGYNWALIELFKRFKAKGEDINLKTFTGASAGSINALISAIEWCKRDNIKSLSQADNNLFYNTWIDIDYQDLIIKGKSENKTTLFKRDALITKANAIIDYMKKPIYKKGCRVNLGFAVTKALPIKENFRGITIKNQSFNIILELYEKNGRLYLKNKPFHDSLLYKIEIPGIQKDISKIKDILFASSAFPGAFEAVKLDFIYKGKKESGYFIDGGVYNNIPLDLAIALNKKANYYLFIDPDNLREGTKRCKDKINNKVLQTQKSLDDSSGFLGTNLLPLMHSVDIFRAMKLYEAINRYFKYSKERNLILSTRYHPITGNFLWAFGAFLDRNFREYDYYVGVYDAIYSVAKEAIARGFIKQKEITIVMDNYKNLLGLKDDALVAYNMLKSIEFCKGKVKDSKFYAIYKAFDKKAYENERYKLKEFKKFITKLDISKLDIKEDSFLYYAKEYPNDWNKKLVREFVARVATLESQKAQDDPGYESVERALDFATWIGMGYLTKKEGLVFQPLLVPESLVEDNIYLYKALPSEFAIDTLNGGYSLGYSLFWYEDLGFFDGIEFKLSFNHSKHITDHLRLDIDPFIRKKALSFGAGLSLFGNLEGKFWNRDNAFGANAYIDYNEILRFTYVRRFGKARNQNYFYFGIKNIPSLFYWLNH